MSQTLVVGVVQMIKLLLLLSVSLALFADTTKDIRFPKETIVIDETEHYTVICIRGYEYILDLQGTISQSFEKVTYNVTGRAGVESIPVQVPIQCKGKEWNQVLK